MKVSVVIPAYNEEKYIETCLQSLMQQEEPADEIIVVDNNSTDRTVEIASQYPVKILHEKRQGITPTRNAGYDAAQYDIIARTDADTILPTNWIHVIKNEWTDPSIVALAGPTFFYDAPHPQATTKLQSFVFFTGSKLLLGHETTHGPNTALKKTAWEQIRDKVCLDDHMVHEDMDLAIHLSKVGTIKYVPAMMNQVSARRLNHNFSSIATDYSIRWIKTCLHQRWPNFSLKSFLPVNVKKSEDSTDNK